MLEEIRESYQIKAMLIPHWDSLSVHELAEGFLNARSPIQQDAYFAALVCHYWFYIKIFIHKNKGSDIPVEECYNWLIEGIQRALGAKWGQRWRDPSNKLHGDPNAVDKSIKRCLASVRAGYYQDANRVKRKANYITDSLEQYCDEFGDYYFNLIEEARNCIGASDACRLYIQDTFDEGHYLEGIILDEICYQDCFRGGKLNKRKLAADLRALNKNYRSYLWTQYRVSEDHVREVQNLVSEFTNEKLQRRINRILERLRENKALVEALCY